MAEKIGLVAGNGRLPIFAARGILESGRELVAVGLAEEASPDLLEEIPALALLPLQDLGRIAAFLRERGASKVVMAGKVHKLPLFAKNQIGGDLAAVIAALPRKNDDAILRAVVDFMAREGLCVLPQTEFLRDLLPARGVLSRRSPDAGERADIAFGFEIAKQIGRLDLGQSVVVKAQAVLAVEAVEGTDETISRGGRLGRGRATLVKVSKPQQDFRFDVPTVGLNTIAGMEEAGVSVLAIEAGKTLFLDRAACLERADASGLAVVALDSNGGY